MSVKPKGGVGVTFERGIDRPLNQADDRQDQENALIAMARTSGAELRFKVAPARGRDACVARSASLAAHRQYRMQLLVGRSC